MKYDFIATHATEFAVRVMCHAHRELGQRLLRLAPASAQRP